MKTTIEVNGFEIKIEELEGKIIVSAHKDDEVIEEFALETGAPMEKEEDTEEVMPFGEEEDDFEEAQEEEEENEIEEMEEEAEELEEEEEEEEEGKLESFSSFIKNRKK